MAVLFLCFSFRFFSSGVTIGFEQTTYTAIEGIDLAVEMCAVLTMGVLEREAIVMFSTTDGTAEAAGYFHMVYAVIDL